MKIICAFGTRPDQIKMAPVIEALRAHDMDVKVWYSGQGWDLRPAEYQYVVTHTERIEWPTQASGVADTIKAFDGYLRANPADVVLVHGDDATAYACAVAAFLNEVPIGHVEAGLRTYEPIPYPEEAYRRMVTPMAHYHFCPDEDSKQNIWRESAGKPMKTYVVGNTINDTLEFERENVLVTLHRRENWGKPIQNALNAMAEAAEFFDFAVIRHPNWQNQYDLPENLTYLDPLSRNDFMQRLKTASFIITDSGGIQEECAYLAKECWVYRESTERTELQRLGVLKMCYNGLGSMLARRVAARFSYGDGTTGAQIAQILKDNPPT